MSDMSCAQQLRSANICVQVDSQSCVSCFDPATFQTALAQETSLEFQKAMASAMPSDPTFCDVANKNVCDYYIANQSCCCQEETAAYRQCLFNEVLVPSVGLISTQCSDTCSQKLADGVSSGGDGDGDGGGGGTGIIIGAIVGLLLLVGILGAIYIYRRRNRVGDLPTTTRTNDKKKSFLASFAFQMPKLEIPNKRRAPEKKMDEEAPAPSKRTHGSLSSSSESSSPSSSNSDDSSASSSSDDSSAASRQKDKQRTAAKKTVKGIPSSNDSSVSSSDFKPKRVPSRNEDALNKATQQQKGSQRSEAKNQGSQRSEAKRRGSQRSVPTYISADSLEEPHPQQPSERKSAKEPSTRSNSSDREISGSSSSLKSDALKAKCKAIESWNAEKKQGASQKSLQSHVSSTEKRSPSAPARSSSDDNNSSRNRQDDQQGMKEMVTKLESTKKELTNQLEELEAQAFALKIENNSTSKQLNKLVKDRAETTLRLSQLEQAKAKYETRVRDAETEADALRMTHDRDSKIIAELQAKNEQLGRVVKQVRSVSEELHLEESDDSDSSSLSKDKDNKAPKSRLPKSGGHKLVNTVGDFNKSWTHESVQAFEKWELKIKRAPGLCSADFNLHNLRIDAP